MIVSIKTMDSIYFLNKGYTIDGIYSMIEDRPEPQEFINLVMYNGSKIIIAISAITSVCEVDEKRFREAFDNDYIKLN